MPAKIESIKLNINTLEAKNIRMAKKQLAEDAKFATKK